MQWWIQKFSARGAENMPRGRQHMERGFSALHQAGSEEGSLQKVSNQYSLAKAKPVMISNDTHIEYIYTCISVSLCPWACVVCSLCCLLFCVFFIVILVVCRSFCASDFLYGYTFRGTPVCHIYAAGDRCSANMFTWNSLPDQIATTRPQPRTIQAAT